jgi:hypothetical protein
VSSTPPDLPRFGVIEAALRRTTEHLARELAHPRDSAPDWNPFEWDVARAVSAMQGITVLLAHGLRWRGPASWQQFLRTQRRQALQRDARIATTIERIGAALQAAGVGAVGLKGTALRRLGLYRAGERPMGDIDLLVQAADVPRVARALSSLDYTEAFVTLRHRVFTPRETPGITRAGEHPDNPLKIEVHESVGELLPVRRVDITGTLAPPDSTPGLLPYRDEAELLRHLLLHAASNMRAHALRQVQLHDIALLAPRLGPGAWDKLLGTPAELGGCWWMYPPLKLALHYYPGCATVPLEDFERACPRVLRTAARRDTLTGVSWSNLRIHAFPGICWSRSPLEALRYARQRFLPDKTAIEELHVKVDAQPALYQVPWYGLGHGQRILRWVVSRPPRVQTLVSLRGAIEEARGTQ